MRVKMRTWMLLEFLGDILYHKRREIVINPVYHNVQWMILALHSCVLQLFLKMIFCYNWIHNRFISIQAWKCVIVIEVWYTLYDNYLIIQFTICTEWIIKIDQISYKISKWKAKTFFSIYLCQFNNRIGDNRPYWKGNIL